MGTPRMGRDPKTSVLNARNRLYHVKNLSSRTWPAWQQSSYANPCSASAFAVAQMKKNKL
jgi:choline dehydrogenase-like flavoprotein